MYTLESSGPTQDLKKCLRMTRLRTMEVSVRNPDSSPGVQAEHSVGSVGSVGWKMEI